MLILDTHIVPLIEDTIRFSDYACGLFPQFPSRKSVKKAIKRGDIILNGEVAKTGRYIQEGDVITWVDNGNRLPMPYYLQLDVIFEDAFLAVVKKPAGIIVSGNQFCTVENALMTNLQKSAEPDALPHPRPVHRLDRPTSGLLLVAKTAKMQIALNRLFEQRNIEKTYRAVVHGTPPDAGSIETAIKNQQAISKYTVCRSVPSLKSNSVSLLELSPKTGRSHQLRIHLGSIGHPIVGDKLYGEAQKTVRNKGLFLSATRLQFVHPAHNQTMDIAIEPPPKFESFLEREKRRYQLKRG